MLISTFPRWRCFSTEILHGPAFPSHPQRTHRTQSILARFHFKKSNQTSPYNQFPGGGGAGRAGMTDDLAHPVPPSAARVSLTG